MTLFSRLKGWRTLAFNIVAGIAPAWDVTVALIGFLLADRKRWLRTVWVSA